MLFTKTTFLGIDPTAGEKPFSIAALDHNLGLIALEQGSIEEILAFVAGQEMSVVAICAPRRINQGVMRNDEVRQTLSPSPHPGRWLDFRLADYLLRRRNIRAPRTPSDESECPNWMKVGFVLYKRLESLGYTSYPQENGDRQYLEVYPYASFATILGVLPLPKHTLEGRLQRQLILFEKGVDIVDPMRIFEEITRHRLLLGVLPLDSIHNAGELDALVAAYTAWLAITKPMEITLLGDLQEGQVVLPGKDLKLKYQGLNRRTK